MVASLILATYDPGDASGATLLGRPRQLRRLHFGHRWPTLMPTSFFLAAKTSRQWGVRSWKTRALKTANRRGLMSPSKWLASAKEKRRLNPSTPCVEGFKPSVPRATRPIPVPRQGAHQSPNCLQPYKPSVSERGQADHHVSIAPACMPGGHAMAKGGYCVAMCAIPRAHACAHVPASSVRATAMSAHAPATAKRYVHIRLDRELVHCPQGLGGAGTAGGGPARALPALDSRGARHGGGGRQRRRWRVRRGW